MARGRNLPVGGDPQIEQIRRNCVLVVGGSHELDPAGDLVRGDAAAAAALVLAPAAALAAHLVACPLGQAIADKLQAS